MKYRGIYWTLFAPMIKKSIAKRFDRKLADRSIRQGKEEYRRLLSRADDLGPGNPMAANAYFAYAFAAAWLGSGKKISPDDQLVRRKGRLYVINKKKPKNKQRQG